MRRPSHPNILLVVALCALVFGAACAALQAAAAPGDSSPAPQEGSGRSISASDWIAHLPLACGMALLVIVVDAAFVVKIVIDRRKTRRAPSSSSPATVRR